MHRILNARKVELFFRKGLTGIVEKYYLCILFNVTNKLIMIAKNVKVIKNQYHLIPHTHGLFVEISDIHKQNMRIYTGLESDSFCIKRSFNPMKISEQQMMLEIVINLNQKFPDHQVYLYEHKEYEYTENRSEYYHEHLLFEDVCYKTLYQLYVPKELINEDPLSIISNLTYFMD